MSEQRETIRIGVSVFLSEAPQIENLSAPTPARSRGWLFLTVTLADLVLTLAVSLKTMCLFVVFCFCMLVCLKFFFLTVEQVKRNQCKEAWVSAVEGVRGEVCVCMHMCVNAFFCQCMHVCICGNRNVWCRGRYVHVGVRSICDVGMWEKYEYV